MNPVLFNIQHFSIHDGYGIRTILFFKGCPLSCRWCHNPEGQSLKKTLSYVEAQCALCGKCLSVCPAGAHVFEGNQHILLRERCIGCQACADVCSFGALESFGKEYSIDEIIREVGRDRAYYGESGGVTISGGEPFTQFSALIDVLKALKENGYHTCIETSGYTSAERIRQAYEYTDLFLYDVKCIDSDKHRKYTGVDNQMILDNLRWLLTTGKRVWVRIPIIPTFNDTEKEMLRIKSLLDSYGAPERIELLPYHAMGEHKYAAIGKTVQTYSVPSEEKMMRLKKIFL